MLPEYHEDSEQQIKLLVGIHEEKIIPCYCIVCVDLSCYLDHNLLARMQAANRAELSEFEKENDSDTDDNDNDDEFKLRQGKLG
jgi:hypothetical protein